MHLRAARIATREDELIMALIFVLSEGSAEMEQADFVGQNSNYAKQ